MLSFPPHCSHKLQPLDRTVFGPFKRVVNSASSAWMVNHPGSTMTIYDIPGIVKIAFPMSFTQSNIISGFAVTGIFPFNRDIFSEADFLPSDVTNRPCPLPQEKTPAVGATPNQKPVVDIPADSVSPSGSTPLSSPAVTLEQIRPYPKAGPRKNSSKGRKKGSTKILTDTPIKEKIAEEARLKRERKEMQTSRPKAAARKKLDLSLSKNTSRKRKHRPRESSSDSEASETAYYSGVDNDIENCSSSEEEGSVELNVTRPSEDDMQQKPQINDYVLVKFPTKRTVLHYVGLVESVGESEYEVSFLKKCSGQNGFVYPEEEDKGWYSCDEIIMILPPPNPVGGTLRCARKIVFPCDLSNYEGL